MGVIFKCSWSVKLLFNHLGDTCVMSFPSIVRSHVDGGDFPYFPHVHEHPEPWSLSNPTTFLRAPARCKDVSVVVIVQINLSY